MMQEFVVTTEPTDVNFAPPSDTEEVLQNVRTILLTSKYSVPLDRDFGIDATILDKPLTIAIPLLQAEITDAIKRYEPRAKVMSVTFEDVGDSMDGILKPKVKIRVEPEKFTRWNT